MEWNFFYQNTAASRTSDLGATALQIPILSVLCLKLNFFETPSRTKFLVTPLVSSTCMT